MTLSLDDVRNKRFRQARRGGYEVEEVDDFVDQIEESFAQLIEENQNLKKQIESLRAGGATERPAGEVREVPRPVAAPTATAAPDSIVVTTGPEASTAVVRLVQMSTEQAERLLAEAAEEAVRVREEAEQSAHQVTTDARAQAERLESEVRLQVERLQSEALGRAEQMDRETDERRRQLFGDIEAERDQLARRVADLRRFEAAFRANLADHLRGHLDLLETGRAEPSDVPPLAQPGLDSSEIPPARSDAEEQSEVEPTGGSETPRLDALLGEQR